jgi:hypothetical protein
MVQACMLVALEEEAAFRRHQDSVLNRFGSHSQKRAGDLKNSSQSWCGFQVLQLGLLGLLMGSQIRRLSSPIRWYAGIEAKVRVRSP